MCFFELRGQLGYMEDQNIVDWKKMLDEVFNDYSKIFRKKDFFIEALFSKVFRKQKF